MFLHQVLSYRIEYEYKMYCIVLYYSKDNDCNTMFFNNLSFK